MTRRKRGVAAVVAMLLGWQASAAIAQARPPIVVRAERCLAEKADAVVAVEQDIQAAASFLVEFACAAEVAGAMRYERNLAFVEATVGMSKSLDGRQPGFRGAAPAPTLEFSAKVDPETGDIITDGPGTNGAPPFPFSNLEAMSKQSANLVGWAVSPSLRALAGELVLKARERTEQPRRSDR